MLHSETSNLLLEYFHLVTSRPKICEIRSLGIDLKLSFEQVQNWFMNKRAFQKMNPAECESEAECFLKNGSTTYGRLIPLREDSFFENSNENVESADTSFDSDASESETFLNASSDERGILFEEVLRLRRVVEELKMQLTGDEARSLATLATDQTQL
ncbi:unnamed protein product, partial [Mesorhabditis belari]|uniref:Homeobox domain-containing protein n=1 Tax=Mesorhabditis belari TaxID=2138241 RepID=A0AAF3EBF3_9BILA